MPDNHLPDPDVTLHPPTAASVPGSTVRAADTASDQQTDETVLPSNTSSPSTDAGDDATRVQSSPHARRPQTPGLLAVPGYVVTREVARGGMGAVYLAHDPAFDRAVAVKVMHAGQDADRFVIESKVTAQLPHPGVPPVYALGTLTDGRPFLAMKLIEGRTLADELKAAQQRPDASRSPELLGAFERICETVGFAHARGIIHRDLKPANVMVGAFGEVLVMDWGLARAVGGGQKAAGSEESDPLAASRRRAFDTGDDETQAGQIKGTPAYMAPEQARGEPVDARADVFALGGILAAILTGKAPFGGTTVMETVTKAAQADVTECFARLDACAADLELVAVAKTCMAGRADDRYANGEDVARAVASYRAGVEERLRVAERDRAAAEAKAAEEVNTRREAEARAAEQRKRRRVQLALAACVVLFAATGAGFAWHSDRQAAERKLKSERDAAEQRAKEDHEAADRRATEAKLQGERDAEMRNKLTQARTGVTACMTLAATLRKQYKFKEAKTALEQAAKLAEGAPELLPQVNQALADLAFVKELDDIRYRKWVWNTGAKSGGEFDTNIAPPAYRKEFAARGLDVVALDPAEAANRIAASGVKAELVAALDDWALYEPDEKLENRVLDIARRADPGQWTDRLRDPAVRKNPLLLAGLIASMDSNAPSAVLGTLAALLGQLQLDMPLLLSEAWHQNPADFELSFQLAQYYIARNRGVEAIAPYKAALAIRPDNIVVWNNLGVALYGKGDKEGAADAFLRAAKLNPDYAPALSNVGKVAADKGDIDLAVRWYRKAVKADPKHINAQLGLGNALLDKKDFDGAVKSFKAIIELEPNNAAAHNNLGNALAATGDPDAAVKSYKTALENDSDYALPWHGIGAVLEAKGDRDGALAAYKKAVEIDPKFVAALMDMGNILRKKGDADGAVAAQKKAVEIAPENAVTHYHLGLALDAKGDEKAAATAYREALKRNPTFFQAWTNLSGVLNDLGDFDAAIVAAREAMKCDPKDSRPHNNTGISLINKRDFDGAVAAFREAVRLNPKNVQAQENLAQSLKDKAAHDEKVAPPPREVKRP